MTDPFVGRLTFFRVYSGVLQSGSYVLNTSKGKRERIGRILQMHANTRQEIRHCLLRRYRCCRWFERYNNWGLIDR